MAGQDEECSFNIEELISGALLDDDEILESLKDSWGLYCANMNPDAATSVMGMVEKASMRDSLRTHAERMLRSLLESQMGVIKREEPGSLAYDKALFSLSKIIKRSEKIGYSGLSSEFRQEIEMNHGREYIPEYES